jgi:hypothetical protein
VAGARVTDDFVDLLIDAARTSERVVVVGILGDDEMLNDGPAMVLGPFFGPRSYHAITTAIEARFGTMEAFYEAHPNVAVGSTDEPITHAHAGNSQGLNDAVRRTFGVLEDRREAPSCAPEEAAPPAPVRPSTAPATTGTMPTVRP